MNYRVLAVVATVILLSSCRKEAGKAGPGKLEEKVITRSIRLFFEGPDMRLAAESRTLSIPENDAAAATRVLAELMKGPANPATSSRLFPADAMVRAAYVLPDGNMVVDLGGPTLVAGWNTGSHTEMMAIYSLVETVTYNFERVKRVRILVNGQAVDTLGGHIALGRAMSRHATLVR